MSKESPPESIAWLHHAAAAGQVDARLMLQMLERLEALEQRPTPGTVELAAPTPEAAPVATGEELCKAYKSAPGLGFVPALRAVYDYRGTMTHPDDFTIEWTDQPDRSITDVRITRGKALYCLPRWRRWLTPWRWFRHRSKPVVPFPTTTTETP